MGWLEGSQAAALSHAELEDELDRRGRELLRQMVQGQLDLRAMRERRAEEVTDADGVLNDRSVQDGIDPTTTSGRLMLNMLATLTEYERELITERVNAGIAAARQSGTRFGRPPVDPKVVAEKLAVATDARAKGCTAADAAQLVGWSRATLYRHQAEANRAPGAKESAR